MYRYFAFSEATTKRLSKPFSSEEKSSNGSGGGSGGGDKQSSVAADLSDLDALDDLLDEPQVRTLVQHSFAI